MGALTKDQRKLLGEFCVNFAIAWLSVGLIAPLLSFSYTQLTLVSLSFSVTIGGMFLNLGVLLVKGK